MAQSILQQYPELDKTRRKDGPRKLKMRGKETIDEDALGWDAEPVEEETIPLGSDAEPVAEEPPLNVERMDKPRSIMDTPAAEVPKPAEAPTMWDRMTSPLWEGPSRLARRLSGSEGNNPFSIANLRRNIGDDSTLGRAGSTALGFVEGAVEGLGDVASSLTSPVDLAATVATGGSSIAARQGLKSLAKGLTYGARAASAPVALHGGQTILDPETSLAEKGYGLAELAGGLAGVKQPHPTVTPRGNLNKVAAGVIDDVDAQVPPSSPPPSPAAVVDDAAAVGDVTVKKPTIEVIEKLEAAGYRLVGVNEQGHVRYSKNVDPNMNAGQGNPELAGSTPYDLPLRDEPLPFEDVAFSRSGIETPPPPNRISDAIKRQMEQVQNRARPVVDTRSTEASPEVMARIEAENRAIENQLLPPEFDRGGVRETMLRNEQDPRITNPELFHPRKTEEPSFARTEGGKVAIGADVKSLGKVLGNSLYKGDISTIATKELLQNSMDAIRGLGPQGKIDVSFDTKNHTLQVEDNGPGLTREQLETIFTDLGSSGKRSDESAIGGFGLAKAAPLLGGENVTVVSIAKRPDGTVVKSEFSGTPDDMLAGVDITETVMPQGTPTGMSVKVKVPEGSGFYDANRFVKNISQYSKMGGAQVRSRNYHGFWSDQHSKWDMHPEVGGGTPVATLENASARTSLTIPADAEIGSRSSVEMIFANKGMYQGKETIWLPGKAPDIPSKVVVDIDSKVPEGHADYPFTANRETLRGTVMNDVKKYINEQLIDPALKNRKLELQKTYAEMPYAAGSNGTPIFFHDTGGRFTPNEFTAITRSPELIALGDQIDTIMKDAIVAMGDPIFTDKIERVGIVFDEGLRGVYIPNPGAGKAAILINPLGIMTNNTPDQAASGFVHTILHELAHAWEGDHNESFAVKLADIHEKFGAEATVSAVRQFRNSVSVKQPNGTFRFNDKVQKLLLKYTEARGRGNTKSDALTRTGVKSESSGSGQKGNAGNTRPNGSGTTARRITLDTPTAETIRKKMAEGYAIGRFTSDHKLIMNWVGKPKALPILESQIDPNPHQPTRPTPANARQQLGQVVDEARVNPIIEAINLPRGLMATMDFSGPLRQGIGLIHKPQFWKALGTMFKAYGSEKVFQAIQQDIAERPLFRARPNPRNPFKPLPSFAEDAGLKLSDLKGLSTREEAIMSTWSERIPIAGKAVRAHNRAYVAFLNKLRADTFETLLDQGKVFGADGKTNLPLARGLADFVNTATGRGDLGRLERSATVLNSILFSPRLMASRLRMLNPKYYWAADPMVRQEAVKSLLAIATTGAVVGELGKMIGGTVSTDPNSSDFGKLKVGDVRIDPYGGFQQYIVAANRLLRPSWARIPGLEQINFDVPGSMPVDMMAGYAGTGGQVFSSSTSDNQYDLWNPSLPANLDHKAVVEKFVRGKAHPVLGFAWSLFNGMREITGEPMDFATMNPADNAIAQRFIPIIFQDVMEIAQQDPTLLPWLVPPAAFGMGVQHYGDQ